MSDFCEAAVEGFKEQPYRQQVRCEIPVARAEVSHLTYWYDRGSGA